MLKGEKRKYDIVRTAEDLFYQRGYENTTIQDILDAVSLSKGGFYHHYASKEQLLDEICDKKATAYYLHALDSVEKCEGTAVDKFNVFFDRNGMWQEDNLDFLGLLIQVAQRENNLMLRERLKKKIVEKQLPVLQQVVREGSEKKLFYTLYPDEICHVLLNLSNDFNDELASYILSCGYKEPDMGAVLRILEVYRNTIEKLLDAPYASITLYQMNTLAYVCQEVWAKHVKVLYDDRNLYNPLAVGKDFL